MTEDVKKLSEENARLRTIIARHGISLLPEPDLPNSEELDRLLSMVWSKYPVLKSPEANYKAQVSDALRYLAVVYRPDKPDTLHDVRVWIGNATEFLKGQGFNPPSIGLKAFVAACLAARVSHEPLDEFPFAVNLGLSLGSASKPSAAWRDVLRDGLRPPTEPRNRAPVPRATNINVSLR